jgi:hypothetical protein
MLCTIEYIRKQRNPADLEETALPMPIVEGAGGTMAEA